MALHDAPMMVVGRLVAAAGAVVALLAFVSTASGERQQHVTATTLPARYLVTTYNPTIAARRGANLESVELVDGRGRLIRRIEQGCCGIGDARFSPDGAMLAWVDSRGLNIENADGTHRRLLVPASRHCTLECIGISYAWAPNSDSITVGGAGVQTGELLTVDVQTGAVRDLASPARFTEYDVIGYSPDGTQLAIDIQSGDAGTSSCCKSLLVVEHPDGTDRRVLFSFSDPIHDGPGDATWSPDSTHMAFTDDGMDLRDPRFGIVDVAAASVRSITGLNVADSPPLWSPDGSELTAVTYTTHPGPIYSVNTVNLASGKGTKVGLGSVPIAWYSGGTILTVGGKNDDVLYALSAAGGLQRPLFTLPKPLQFLMVEPAP